ncbi:MAG: hypothetical protein HW421_2233 [Ignavibacteria bacterium]|nr:hypothetical protein [Ignavibacteria bacterium]
MAKIKDLISMDCGKFYSIECQYGDSNKSSSFVPLIDHSSKLNQNINFAELISKNLIFLLFFSITSLILSIAAIQPAFAGTPMLTKEQLRILVPSDQRFVQNLSGKWERTINDIDWEQVTLPFGEEQERDVTYKTTIKIEKKYIGSYTWHLYFLGVDDQVRVFINERYIGSYFGGMTPLSVRIPQQMISSEVNNIKLIVSPATYAAGQIKNQIPNGKKVLTGIIRDILLVGTPSIWINAVKHKMNLSNNLSVCELKTTVNICSGGIERSGLPGQQIDSGKAKALSRAVITIETSINKKTGEPVAAATTRQIDIESERTVNVDMPITVHSPELWTTDSPFLYDLVVKIKRNGVVIDDYHTDIGFRQIRTKQEEGIQYIMINNQPFLLKGCSYIEDYGGSEQTLSIDRMEKDIVALKTLGANTVRFKFSSAHPYLVHLCDKYGLYAMIELPLYNVPSQILNLDEIKVRMKNNSRQILFNYDTHPCVLGYGIGDCSEEYTEEGKSFLSAIFDNFRNGTSNLIYKIGYIGSSRFDNSFCDFVGLVTRGNVRDLNRIKNDLAVSLASLSTKPVFLSFGTTIQPDNSNGYSDPLSIEAQSNFIRNLYKISSDSRIFGAIINTYNDYRANNPSMVTNYSDMYLNPSGMVDRYRQQRLTFFMVKALFNEEKEPLLNAGSYYEKTPVIFIIFGILLALIIGFMGNRFRRFREYLFRSLLRPYNFYADVRDQRIMSSLQTVILSIVISFTIGIFVSTILYYYRNNFLSDYFFKLFVPSNDILEYIYYLVWMPELLMFIVSVIFILIFLMISLFLRVIAFFIRARINFADAFTISIWSAVPMLGLLPLSVVLIRLLVVSPSQIWVAAILFLILTLWVWFRFLRCSAVVFDVLAGKVYIIGNVLLATICGSLIGLYQYYFVITAYGQYYFNMLISNM